MTTAVVDRGTTRDGILQLRRRWPAASPRAATVLLHGLGEHSGRYEHVGTRLAGHGIDVVAVDLRGHGWSGGRRGHVERFDAYLDDVEDQLAEVRRLALPTVLVGHSFGGLIALAYVLSERPVPDLLVLSAPALTADLPPWQRIVAPALGRVAPRLFVPGVIEPDMLATDPSVGAAYAADPLVLGGATAGLAHAAFGAMADTRSRVHHLDVPTLVVHGGADRLVPPAASEPLAGRPGVHRVVYPGLRHEVFNEPDGPAIVDEVAGWILRRLDS